MKNALDFETVWRQKASRFFFLVYARSTIWLYKCSYLLVKIVLEGEKESQDNSFFEHFFIYRI